MSLFDGSTRNRNPVIPRLDFILGTQERGVYLSKQGVSNGLSFMTPFSVGDNLPMSEAPVNIISVDRIADSPVNEPSYVKSFSYKRLFRNFGGGTWTLELFDPTFALLEYMDYFFLQSQIIEQNSSTSYSGSFVESSYARGASLASMDPVGVVEFRFGYGYRGDGGSAQEVMSPWVRGFILKFAPKISKAGVSITLEGIDFSLPVTTTTINLPAVYRDTDADGNVTTRFADDLWTNLTFETFMTRTLNEAEPRGVCSYNLVFSPAVVRDALMGQLMDGFPEFFYYGRVGASEEEAQDIIASNSVKMSSYIRNGNLYLPEFLTMVTDFLHSTGVLQSSVNLRLGTAPSDSAIAENEVAYHSIESGPYVDGGRTPAYIWIDDYVQRAAVKEARKEFGEGLARGLPVFTVFGTKTYKENLSNESNVETFEVEVDPVPPAMLGAATNYGVSVSPLTFDEVTVESNIEDNTQVVAVTGESEDAGTLISSGPCTKSLYTGNASGQNIGLLPSGVSQAMQSRQEYYNRIPLRASMSVAFPDPDIAPWEILEVNVITPRESASKYFTSGYYMVTDITYSLSVGSFKGVFKMFKSSIAKPTKSETTSASGSVSETGRSLGGAKRVSIQSGSTPGVTSESDNPALNPGGPPE